MIGDAKAKLNRGHRAFQQPNLTDCVIYLYERRPELFEAIPRSHLATLLDTGLRELLGIYCFR